MMASRGEGHGRGRSTYSGYTSARPAVLGLAKIQFLALGQVSMVAAAPLKDILWITEDEEKDPEDAALWLYLTVAMVLVLLGGAFAGLTIALMGQDGIYLQVIATSGEGKEQKHAQKVWRLLKRGKHWVLVTLLLSNVIVNETLPIVLDRSLGGGWPAVLGSTVLIVIFGEVIPQSICVRYGLQIGAAMSPFVLVLMYLLAPVAWPTAKLLDWLLGEDHGTMYKKSGLKTLVTLHKTLGTSPSDRLNQDEVTIISAVLDLKDKPVGDIMTPMDDVFTMSSDTVLDEKTMDVILSAGYSRIPIYEPGNERNFVGMLLVKILITYDPEDAKRVSEFSLATLPETAPETSCLDIVNFFQEGKSHMVLVSEFPGENYGAIGVVTLEDVIEELIGEEIIDESDVFIDVHKAIRRMTPAPRARVAKGQVVADPDAATVPEDHLIDLEEEHQPDTSRPKLESAGSKADNPKASYIMRRHSSIADGRSSTPVSGKGNAAGMREHLRHLGPSNVASRPKSTRYNTVKIKPGLSPAPLEQGKQSPAAEAPYRDEPAPHAPSGGEGEGLLKSAGKEASDGVQALQQGYGSMSRSPDARRAREQDMDGQQDVVVDERTQSRPSRPRDRRSSSQDSEDTIGSLQSKSESRKPRKRNPARSGSITENIVDHGGVRKVVLETNSSSEDAEEGATNGDSGTADKDNDSHTDLLGEQNNGNGNDSNQTDAKKKRKRRSKRKGAKGDDEEGGHK